MPKKIAFIINPKAGVKKKMDIPLFIIERISKNVEYEIFMWDRLDKIKEIAVQVMTKGFDVAVAVGGDGTVNEVAKMVNGTNVALGILPFGSGNGLARSVGIPMNIEAALQCVCGDSVKTVDSGSINGKPFFCTAGVGFDAHIGKLFSESKTRGFKTYFTITTREFFGYQPKKYTITVDGKKSIHEAFLITVGNAGQWGNDVFICPQAKMDDGILHTTVLKKFSKWRILGIAVRLFRKRIHTSSAAEILAGKEILIEREEAGAAHYDGEPDEMGTSVLIKVHPLTLKIVC